jgi:hypothetical protein
MKVQMSLDMSHNVYIIVPIKSVSSLIVLLQTKLCNGGLMAHTRMFFLICPCMYFDASREDASNV